MEDTKKTVLAGNGEKDVPRAMQSAIGNYATARF